ncbi:hypothetical protein ABXT16_12735, partial [Staphylococcus epidermidis]|uniref:hypothetical protein n=1 Tax=Staphylococcus epidermidis TaxID=1282 RepID=UPI0033960A90
LGNKQDAIEAAAALAKLDFYEVKTIKHSLTPQEQMMQDIFGNASVKAFIGGSTTTQSVLASQTDLNSIVKKLSTE